MRSLTGLTIGALLGTAVAIALAVAAGSGSVPWFLVFVPAGMILGCRAWRGLEQRKRPPPRTVTGAWFAGRVAAKLEAATAEGFGAARESGHIEAFEVLVGAAGTDQVQRTGRLLEDAEPAGELVRLADRLARDDVVRERLRRGAVPVSLVDVQRPQLGLDFPEAAVTTRLVSERRRRAA